MADIWSNALKQAIPGGGTVVALHPKIDRRDGGWEQFDGSALAGQRP
jgi:hypothetical protein